MIKPKNLITAETLRELTKDKYQKGCLRKKIWNETMEKFASQMAEKIFSWIFDAISDYEDTEITIDFSKDRNKKNDWSYSCHELICPECIEIEGKVYYMTVKRLEELYDKIKTVFVDAGYDVSITKTYSISYRKYFQVKISW